MPLVLTKREVELIMLGLGYLCATTTTNRELAQDLVEVIKNNPDCKNWILHEDERKRM